MFWFTSDYHLSHTNIIEYCKRPFKSGYHMNSTIIRNHNERVNPNHIVYHIGDFCLKDGDEFLPQFNGNIIFIKGNHDGQNGITTNMHACLIHHGGKLIYLVHDPADAEDFVDLNLVGHVHEKWRFSKTKKGTPIVNVGVDVWNFRPIDINEILQELEKWENTKKDVYREASERSVMKGIPKSK